jgi:hypothetical protein
MNVPSSRLEQDSGFNIGRSAEITRDEVKFGKFVTRLRSRFSQLFLHLLETQLRLKGIITHEDWEIFRNQIHFDWSKDTHFIELQETEIFRSRIEMLRDAEEFKGEYFSKEWLRKNILRQSDNDITMIDKQISSEAPVEEEPEEEENAQQ